MVYQSSVAAAPDIRTFAPRNEFLTAVIWKGQSFIRSTDSGKEGVVSWSLQLLCATLSLWVINYAEILLMIISSSFKLLLSHSKACIFISGLNDHPSLASTLILWYICRRVRVQKTNSSVNKTTVWPPEHILLCWLNRLISKNWSRLNLLKYVWLRRKRS